MKCPVCNIELTPTRYADQALDVCSTCRGVWCDDGELGAVAKALIKTGKVSEPASLVSRSPRLHEDDDNREKPCPRCGETTQSFNFAYDSNIFLNRCDACSGIWLDSGELLNVVSFIKKQPPF